MTISIAGRLGQLDELESSLQSKLPKYRLQKSETKLSEDYIKTERLLQVITALIPEEIWFKDRGFNKVYTYSQKAKCLKDFQHIHKKSHDKKHEEYEYYKNLYQFYLDVAAQAYLLYEKWKAHQGFIGTRIRAIKREDKAIKDVPDGIIFPILASFSVFANKKNNSWIIDIPEILSEEEIINQATTIYQEIAGSNPNVMGKNKACYSSLYTVTSIYRKFSISSKVASL